MKNRFDFRLSIGADEARVYPLSEKALAELEKARGLWYPAAFQWYPASAAELLTWRNRGFLFC